MATTKTSPKKRAKPKRPRKPPSPQGWPERTLRGVRFLQVPAFAKIPWLVHGFSTRPGGVSPTDIDNADGEKVLNLGAVEWDSRENVEENKRRFQSALGGTDLKLISLHQIHSDVVRSFDSAPHRQCKGDASATNRPGLLLGIRTAD